MSKIKIIIGVLVLISLQVFAQEKVQRKIPADIVRNDSQVEEVWFEPPQFRSDEEPTFGFLELRIRYFDESGKKRILYPTKAKEFQFKLDGKEIRLISVSHPTPAAAENTSFLELVVDGPVRLFKFHEPKNTGSPGSSSSDMTVTSPTGATGTVTIGTSQAPGLYASPFARDITYIVQKSGKTRGIYPKRIGFKKQMGEYFKDCPVLIDSIETRGYTHDDILRIATIYNRDCGN